MKLFIALIFSVIFYCQALLPQTSNQIAWQSDGKENVIDVTISEVSDNQDDPAYKIYKEGYNLILEEKWDEARKIFTQVKSKYPQSDYVDDAQYWSAYAAKHTSIKKAVDEYSKFIKNYPDSKYYDDAVADLAELKKERSEIIKKLIVKGNARVYVTQNGLLMNEGTQRMYIGEDGVVLGDGPESLVVDKHGITISGDGRNFRYSYGFTPQARTFERAMKLYTGRLNRIRFKGRTPVPFPASKLNKDEDIDPETRLKIEALYSLGEAKEDEKSFQVLKEVALNTKKPRQLREAALEALSDIKKHDVIPVYVDIVKNDTSEDMQIFAIDYINQSDRDKNKTISILVNLFDTLPKQRREQRQMIFYSIADIGNDRAIDFLADVARHDENYDMRRDAIYYLGSIGGEKARCALFEILKEK